MKLNNAVLFIVVLVFFFGGIGAAIIFNVWETKPGKAIAMYEDGNSITPSTDGNTVAPSTGGSFVTPYNPADIRGTHTLAEISQMFNIPLNDLGAAFGLSSVKNLADFRARDLKNVYPNLEKGISLETESVRVFASMYANKQYVYSNTAYLPLSAVKILKEKAKLSREQLAFLDTHTIDISGKQPANTASQETSVQRIVTGETSFQRLLDWGIPREEIEKVIGEKLPATSMLIRDFAAQKNLDFLVITASLQEKVNNLAKPR
jgi:hypothetical protein